MIAQHTPGDWEASTWPAGKIAGLPAGGIAIHAAWKNAEDYSPLIAVIQPAWSNSAHEANARLIAASPELLAACKAALITFDPMDNDHAETVRLLRDAIDRATGGAK